MKRPVSFIAIMTVLVFCFEPAWSSEKIELVSIGSLYGIPDGTKPFGQVIAVEFDPDGSLYLLEEAGRRLIHVSEDGGYIAQAGGFGFGEGAFHKPSDIAMVGFEVWVCDMLGGRIVRFDRHFAPLGAFGRILADRDDPPFERPLSVAQASSGDIVVIEGDREEALLIDPSGRLIDRFAGYGETGEGLISPSRVEISVKGIIAIADPGRRSILLFDKFGSSRGIRPYPLKGEGPLGVAWQGKRLWVCGTGGIAALAPDGKVDMTLPQEKFSGAVRDITVQRDRLAVAAGSSVLIYRVIENER